jgi:polyhydroxybutyrate depolymerase
MRKRLLVLSLGLLCSSVSTLSAQEPDLCRQAINIGRGPVGVYVPESYDSQSQTPLIVLLHGFSSSGFLQSSYMRLWEQADDKNFIYAYPDGTLNPLGERFWNATDACCDFYDSQVDDSAYLLRLIETIESQCNIDPRRIYFGGLSNGGYMSSRMACDHADKIAAVASLAGASFDKRTDCKPSDPIHVLLIHGTADETVLYGGGDLLGVRYPSARRTVRNWARINRCSIRPEVDAKPQDFDDAVLGPEASIERYDRSCKPGSSVQFWSLEGSSHVPLINTEFRTGWVDYLLAHRKPAACETTEVIRDAYCRADGVAIVHLGGGEGGARYTAQLDSGRTASGVLKRNGRARVALRHLDPGPHELTVRWDCGAESTQTVVCPN